MNVRIEAGVLGIKVSATMSDAQIITCINIDAICSVPNISCFSPSTLTINGHSISAINPEFVKEGELATSFA
jgi:hypothetical protein